MVFITIGAGMTCSFVFDRYLTANHTEIFRSINFITSAAVAVSVLFYYVSLMRPRLLTGSLSSLFAEAGFCLLL